MKRQVFYAKPLKSVLLNEYTNTALSLKLSRTIKGELEIEILLCSDGHREK